MTDSTPHRLPTTVDPDPAADWQQGELFMREMLDVERKRIDLKKLMGWK